MSTASRSPRVLRTISSWVLLPDGLPERPTARSARPWWRSPLVADVVITAVVLALSVWNSLKNPYLGPATPSANVLLGALSALPLLARRRAPEAVLALALIAKTMSMSIFALPFAFYAVGACRGPRNRRVAWAAAVVGLLFAMPWDRDAWTEPRLLASWVLVNFVLTILVPLLLGLYMGERRAVIAALVDRAERAEREQLLIAEAARVEERQRIAGEMHDVVSHQVSLIVVHANALATVAHDPKVTAEAAQIIQAAGRQALTELREMLGLLRNSATTANGAGQAEPADARSAPAPATAETPTPGTETPAEATVTAQDGREGTNAATGDRIAELVDASRAAGLPVTSHTEGVPGALTEQVQRAAYRVVQEALTNVHKHAPGAATDIRLDYGPETLRVSVTNGPAARPVDASPDGRGPLLPSGGHGLIGLGERVRLVGGDIETGPLADGGFQVRATLPAAP